MKRLLLLIPILALLLLLMGCGDIDSIINNRVNYMIEGWTGTYTIKVCSNTTGLNFTGEYSVYFCEWNSDTEKIDYSKDSYSVEGQVPEEYTFEADSTTVIFQKRTGGDETLRVEIWRDEVSSVGWRETTDPWGAVWIIGGLYGEG